MDGESYASWALLFAKSFEYFLDIDLDVKGTTFLNGNASVLRRFLVPRAHHGIMRTIHLPRLDFCVGGGKVRKMEGCKAGKFK